MACAAPKPGFPGSPKPKDMNIREPNDKTLTEKRREKLLSIRKREQMKDVLVQRFSQRLNSKEESKERCKENEEVVKSEVAAFMDNASITENNLKRLEKKIRNKVESRDGGSGAGRNKDEKDNYSVLSSSSGAGPKSGVSASHVTGTAVEKESSLVADWRILDDYALHITECDEKKKLEKKRVAQKKMFEDLTRQVELEKSKLTVLKQEDKQYYNDSLKDLELWKKTEDEKIHTMRKRCLIEKDQRDQQLAYDKKTKEVEEVQEKRGDELATKRLEKEIELEKLKVEKKKIQQRKHMAKVYEENEEFQKRKAQDKKDNMERDIAMMKEYNRMKEKEDADKQAVKDERMKKQKDLMERMAKTVLAQQNAADGIADSRAERQREEADKRALEAALNKQTMLQKLRDETRDYHVKQMEEKNVKKQQALEFRQAQAEILVKDAERYAAQEKKKSDARRNKCLENQNEITRQIETKTGQLREVQMSEQEKRINLGLLKHVNKVLKEAGYSPRKA